MYPDSYFRLTFPEYIDLYQLELLEFQCLYGCGGALDVIQYGERDYAIKNDWQPFQNIIQIFIENFLYPHSTFEDDTLKFSYNKANGDIVESTESYFYYIPPELENVSITQSNQIAFEQTKLTFQFDPVLYIPQNGLIQIDVGYLNYKAADNETPLQSFSNSLSCVGIQNIHTDIHCFIDSNNQITIQNGFNSGNSTESTIIFEIDGFINPPSLKPLDHYNIKTLAPNMGTVGKIENLVQVSTQLQDLKQVTLTSTDYSLNSITTLQFNIEPTTFAYENSSIQILFPPEFDINESDGIVFQGINNCQQTLTIQYSGQILLLNNVISNYVQNLAITFELQNFKNIDQVTTTGDIQIVLLDDEGYQQERSLPGLTYTTVPGQIINSELSVSIDTVSELADYTFTFTIDNGLDASGIIEIVFPETYNIQDTTNQNYSQLANSQNVSGTAQYKIENNIYTLEQAFPNGLQQGEEIIFVVQNVQNPSIDGVGENIQLTTYLQNNGQYNILDQIQTLNVQYFPGQIQVNQFNSLISSQVLQETVYQIEFQLQHILPQQSEILLIFDKDDIDFELMNQNNNNCEILFIDEQYYDCNFSNQQLQININQQQVIPSDTEISIKIYGLFTPRSTKIINQVSIVTKTVINNKTGIIDQIFLVPDLLIDTPQFLDTVSIAQTQNQLNEISIYQFEIILTNYLLESDKLLITLPTSLVLTNSIICKPKQGLNIQMTCSKISDNQLEIQLNTQAQIDTQIVFSIESIQNPSTHQDLFPFVFNFLTQDDQQIIYYQDTQGLEPLKGLALNNFSAQLSNSIINQSSSLQIRFENPIAIVLNSQIVIDIPPSLFIISEDTEITGLNSGVAINKISQQIIIENIDFINASTNIQINIMNLQNPSYSNTEEENRKTQVDIQDDQQQSYMYEQYIIPEYQCDQSCQSCENDPNYCLSCNNDQFAHKGECHDSCPDGMFEYQGKCEQCLTDTNSCLYCDSDSPEKCLTCKSNYQLVEGACQQFSIFVQDQDLIKEQVKQEFLLSDEFQDMLDDHQKVIVVEKEGEPENQILDNVILSVYTVLTFFVSAIQLRISPQMQMFGAYMRYLSVVDYLSQLALSYYYHSIGEVFYSFTAFIIFGFSILAQIILGCKMNSRFKDDANYESMMKIPKLKFFKQLIVYFNIKFFTSFYPPKPLKKNSKYTPEEQNPLHQFSDREPIFKLFKKQILTSIFILASSIAIQLSYLFTYGENTIKDYTLTYIFDYCFYLTVYILVQIQQFFYVNKQIEKNSKKNKVQQNPSDVELQKGQSEEEQSYINPETNSQQPTPLKKKSIDCAQIGIDSCMSPVNSNMNTDHDLQSQKIVGKKFSLGNNFESSMEVDTQSNNDLFNGNNNRKKTRRNKSKINN